MLLKSPINRLGGKYFLKTWLSEMIPAHTLYCEPFCGAGHLLFAKENSQVEVVNDIDGDLIGFFRVIQYPETRQMLIDRLNFMPYSRKLWQDIRTQWKVGNMPENEIERVSQWFYLNRTCFSGDQQRGGFATASVTGRNPCISFRNTVKTLDDVAERLRCVIIENLSYEQCLSKYDSPESLFYIDCPYYGAEDYYGDTFTERDHYTLSDILHSVKAKVMLSHYECGTYNQLYHDWNKFTFDSFKGSHKSTGEEKPKTVECLYCNFKPETGGLFQ